MNEIKIDISKEEVESLHKLSTEIAEAKRDNEAYIRDHNKLTDRYLIGLIGERCIEKYSGLSIIEWAAEKEGKRFEHPDIKELGIGIKSVKPGNYPLIYKEVEKNNYPQIIVEIHLTENQCYGIIKGVASSDILQKYQDINKVVDPRARKNKTAFVGLDKLEDISKYVNEKTKQNTGT